MSVNLGPALNSGPQVWPEKQAVKDNGPERPREAAPEPAVPALAPSVGEAEVLKAIE